MQVIEADAREDLLRRGEEYVAPTADELDPSFIFLSPTLLKKKDFEAVENYSDPVEPKVIPAFDWAAQKQATMAAAEEFVDTVKGKLAGYDDVYGRVFHIMASKRYRAGTKKKTRFEENRELFRDTLLVHISAGSPLEPNQ